MARLVAWDSWSSLSPPSDGQDRLPQLVNLGFGFTSASSVNLANGGGSG